MTHAATAYAEGGTDEKIAHRFLELLNGEIPHGSSFEPTFTRGEDHVREHRYEGAVPFLFELNANTHIGDDKDGEPVYESFTDSAAGDDLLKVMNEFEDKIEEQVQALKDRIKEFRRQGPFVHAHR